MEQKVLNMCQRFGHIKGHFFEASLGCLYVEYQEHTQSEAAQQTLTDMVVNDRMLIVTFYPLSSWRGEDFY